MSKIQLYEVICPVCKYSFWIEDLKDFFYSQTTRSCKECNSEIPIGEEGIKEQCLLYLENQALYRAVLLIQEVSGLSQKKAKKFLRKLANQHNIPLHKDATPMLFFFLRVLFSALIGFGFVGIGTAVLTPKIQYVAAPFICDKYFVIDDSEKLRTKIEKQRSYGVELHIYCAEDTLLTEDTQATDITKEAFYVSSSIYSLASFIFLSIRKFIASRKID
ncbi:MAG: hypothetical protein ACP5P3_06655 [Ignavibacteria bacterium]